MARIDTGTVILYGGGIILSYYVLKSWGVIGTPCDPSICTAQCPRGPKYCRGYFEDCDPGYLNTTFGCGFMQDSCDCINAPKAAALDNWTPLSEDEINQLKVMTSPRDIYKDDTFEARTGRGKMGYYGFVGTR